MGDLYKLDYESLWRLARNFARKTKFPQDCEDFAQYVCLIRASGKRKTLRLESLWVDYMRRQYGKSNTPSGTVKLNIRKSLPYEDFHSTASHAHDVEIKEAFERATKNLTKEEHRLALLYFREDLDCGNIGKLLGITENRAWHLVQNVIKKMKINLKLA